MLQLPMYEYIGGFSLTSDTCAAAGSANAMTSKAKAASTHPFVFMFLPPFYWPRTLTASRATAVYTCGAERSDIVLAMFPSPSTMKKLLSVSPPLKAAFWFTACLLCLHTSAHPASGPFQMSTEDRVQRPGWWPTKSTAAREDFVGPEACESCHATKASTQKLTPMAHAASHATDSEALRAHDEMTFRQGPYTYRIKRTDKGTVYSVSDGAQEISITIDWAFGLGESGQTFVLSYQGTMYDSRVSY